MIDKFLKVMEDFAPFENNPEIAVAVSGGSDSLALTFLINEYVKKNGGNLIALTVDHGLREESYDEALKVREKLLKHGIKHEILTWVGEKPKTAIEEKARQARYDLLFNYCKEKGILHLCVGHTKDEQVETFLMRLRRGSGVDGLASIKSEVLTKDLRILRPLLDFTRQDLRDYLNNINEIWIEDPSNQNEDYERVRFRKAIPILSNLGLDVECLNNAVNHMKRAKEALDFLMIDAMVNCVSLKREGFVLFDKEKLQKYPEETVLRVLSRILMVVSNNEEPVRINKLINLKENLNKLGGGVTLNDCFIRDYKNKVMVVKELRILEPSKPFKDFGSWNGFKIKCEGFKGKIGPLGEDGYSQIKNIVRKSYPSVVIKGLPTLFCENKVAFVPHLGYSYNKDMEIEIALDIKFSLT